MSAASNYTENNVINALLRGVPFPNPASVFVSLHTANPGETGINEVSTADWPQYARQDAAAGGQVNAGWEAPDDGVSKNVNMLTYPSKDGAGDVTVTHWALYDAATGGNMLVYAALQTPRTLREGDVFVFDVNTITVSVA